MSTPEEIAAILDMEAMPVPPGEVRDYDNPPNENGLAMAIITITLVIGTLCVILRGYARLYLLRKVQVEEGKSQVSGEKRLQLPILYASF